MSRQDAKDAKDAKNNEGGRMEKEQNANQLRKESAAFDKYDDSSLLSKHELHSEGEAGLQPTLEELLAGVTDDNIHAEIDTGPPVGRELWD